METEARAYNRTRPRGRKKQRQTYRHKRRHGKKMRGGTRIQKKRRAQTKDVTMAHHMQMSQPHLKKPHRPPRCDTVVFTRIPCYVACAIFFQDTALDMNPYEMIVASLDVQGALPHALHRLLTEVWDTMGLPFLFFMTGLIQTRLYDVITAAGLTPWTSTDSGVPQGGVEGPFLHLLVTLPLAFEPARVYPGYALYPLRSPLMNFADDNLLTTATHHSDPDNAGLPTTTEQASTIPQLTTTYLDADQLLVHPRKSVGLADVGTPAPRHPER